MALIYENEILTAADVASKTVMLPGERLTLDFTLVVDAAAAPAQVNWFIEYSRDNPLAVAPLPVYFREVAEEDVGSGVVNMVRVLRTFRLNGGALLPEGTHRFTLMFIRHHKIIRLQASLVGAGEVRLTVEEPFATIPQLTG